MRNHIRRNIVASAVMLALTAVPLQAAAPLADRLPAGCLAYLGWAGMNPAFDQSMMGQLLKEPKLQQIVEAVKQAVIVRDERVRQLVETGWSMALTAASHQAAIALIDFKPGGEAPVLKAAIIVDLGPDKDKFDGWLQGVLKSVPMEIPVSGDGAASPLKYSLPSPQGMPIACGYIGQTFYASVGQDVPEQLFALSKAKDGNLASDGAFAGAFKSVDGADVQMAAYINVKAGLELLKQFDRNLAFDPSVTRIVEALGLGKIDHVVAAQRIVDKGFHTRTRISTPAPHRGLLMLYSGKPLAEAVFTAAPDDADLLYAFNLPAKDLYAEALSVAGQISGRAPAMMSQAMAEADRALGVSIENDILANLGETWSLVSAPSLGGFLTGTVLAVELKDQAKFAAALEKVVERLAPVLAGSSRSDVDGLQRAAKVVTIKAGPAKVQYLAIARGPIPVAPAWAVHDNRLYVALWPQVLESVLQSPPAAPLAKSPAFAKAMSRITGKPTALFYLNTPKVIRQAYMLPLVGWTTGANALAWQTGFQAQPHWLPSLSAFEKYVQPQVGACWSDDQGITFEDYQSLPTSVLSAGALPAFVSMAVPSLACARQRARTSVAATRLKTIGTAIMIYEAQHNDKPPQNLAELVTEGFFDPSILVSPRSGNRPPLMDGSRRLQGDIDYIYIPLDSSAPADAIMAYEDPAYWRDGTGAVLFRDGHVSIMNEADFQAALKRTHEYLVQRAAGR